jgi:hypothetical protein
VSNAQRRRAHRQRGKTFPGPMTQERVLDHQLMTMRLADLERLRRMAEAALRAEEVADDDACTQDG